MPNPLKTWTSSVSEFKHRALAAVLLGILLIAAGWFGVSKIVARNAQEYFNNVNDIQIKTYSLGGKVLETSSNGFKLEAAQIETGSNSLVYVTYEVKVDNSTIYDSLTNTVSITKFSDIQKGKELTVYTSQNPFDSKTITATKVELR